jgi:hypothetical protein
MMYEKFESNITDIFDKHVPVKEKYCRKNQLPYMNRELRKASYNKFKISTFNFLFFISWSYVINDCANHIMTVTDTCCEI